MGFSPIKTFFKAFGLAAVCGAIGFFTGEFLSIIGVALYGWASRHTPDFSVTYKFVAAPLAVLVFITVFVGTFVRDVKKATP